MAEPPEDGDDESLALLLKGTGDALLDGRVDAEEAIQQVGRHLADRDDVEVREGELGTQGRTTFTRSREGQAGMALFIPLEEEADE